MAMTELELLESLLSDMGKALADPRCHTPAFCDRLIDRAEATLHADPKTGAELARTAVDLAARIPAAVADRERTIARALCCLGGAKRCLNDFRGAEAAYILASELLLELDDPRETALFLGRLAYLRRDQRRLHEALELAREAVEITRELDEPRRFGEALVDLGSVYLELGRYPDAVDCCRRAMRTVPALARPYRRAAIHLVLTTLCRIEDSDPSEIFRWLDRARELDREAPAGSVVAVKLRWLEGLAQRRAGGLDLAAEALRAARDGLLELGMGYHAACAAMDLALLYLERGRPGEAAALAREMFPVFQALRVDREATTALSLYVNAAAAGSLTVEIVEDVQRRLEARPD